MRLLVIISAAAAGGCGLYVHDVDRSSSASEARQLMEVATRQSDEAWIRVGRNLEDLDPAERAALEQAEGRLAGLDRRRIYTSDWATLKTEARRALDEDAPLLMELAAEMAGLRARARQARDQLLLVILPQLAAGEAWPEDETPLREALDALGLGMTVETVRQELSGDWSDPGDAAGLRALLDRLGAADPDKLLGMAEGFEDTLARARMVGRRALEEVWPLDDAIRLARQAGHLDLFFGRPYFGDEILPPEIQGRLARVGRIIERRPVFWAVHTPDETLEMLRPFDMRGEMVGRRFQRDILSTRTELLLVELHTLGRLAAALGSKLAVLRDRGAGARGIIAFVDGPLGQIRLGARAAAPEDSVFLTVRAMVDAARAQAVGFAVVPAAAGDGVQFMKDYNARVTEAAGAVEAAAAALRLQGELIVRRKLAAHESERAEHAGSVERSRVAALGWKRLLDDGARGLEAYWSGGIKGEELAKLILMAGETVATSYTALR